MLLRAFLRQINPLNILLFGIIVIILFYIYTSFSGIRISLPVFEQKETLQNKNIKIQADQIYSIAEYIIITEQNLFHPDRKIPPEKKFEQQLPKPEFVLYGTLITQDAMIAYIEDLKAPYSTAGRGKRQKSILLGQSLSGYLVKEIHHDKIIMAKGEETLEVKINANKRSKITENIVPISEGVTTASQSVPTASAKEKLGGGQPPGVVHLGPPPDGLHIPDEKTISKVKETIGVGLIKRPGLQRPSEKPQ